MLDFKSYDLDFIKIGKVFYVIVTFDNFIVSKSYMSFEEAYKRAKYQANVEYEFDNYIYEMELNNEG